MNNIYLKTNSDWRHVSKSKYGYVNGTSKNLVNRLCDSSEEHSELSHFTNIFGFNKNDNYKLKYKEIDKIFSLIGSDIEKIEIVENLYGVELPLLRELNKHLVRSETKKSKLLPVSKYIHSSMIVVLGRFIFKFSCH